jgi:transcriptional regulator with XRE-family HTH domain
VDDRRIGALVRLLRRRRSWRQAELAEAAGMSRGAVSMLERGLLDGVTLGTFRRVAVVLDLRLDVIPRWRGGEVDRILGRRHSLLHEAFARHLRADPAWTFRPEVSYSIFGERGVIDMLAWHPGRSMILVVEFKTELVDVNDLVGSMDRRRRLAIRIGQDLGWRAIAASSLVVLVDGRTNRRRVAEHRTILRAAFPSDGRHLAGWLRDPSEAVSMLAMWPNANHDTTGPDRRGSRLADDGSAAADRLRPRTDRGDAPARRASKPAVIGSKPAADPSRPGPEVS